MDLSNYSCVPACKACREAGVCSKGVRIGVKDYVRTGRIRDPHAGTIQLPCGCWGLPWPVFETFGSGIKEIFCDKHGWKRFDAKKIAKKTVKPKAGNTLNPELPEF